VFSAFYWVCSADRTREIPVQSHVRFSVFFSKIPGSGQTPKFQHFGTRVNSSGSQKNSWITRGFAWNISAPVRVTDLVEVSKDVASLVVCTRKKYFAWGVQVFCECRHKWRTFWPLSPGPGRQPIDGSISLKFLLDSRLQSEPFDTLDDLLGFRVQKL